VISKLEWKLGTDHPTPLGAAARLAQVYRDAGRPGEAVELLERIYPLMGKKIGPEHPETLVVRRELAGARERREQNPTRPEPAPPPREVAEGAKQ